MRESYQQSGYDGLRDRRSGKPSRHRVAMETAEEVLRRYREVYFDLNIRHFHEKLRKMQKIKLSYTWGSTGLAGSRIGGETAETGPTRRRRHDGRCPGCCCTSMAVNTNG